MNYDQEIKHFELEDQHKFARLSADFNPIHIDPISARRSLFGQPIVHGIHALLWMIDRWLCYRPAVRILKLRADFRNAIRLEENIFIAVKVIAEGQVRIEARSDTAQLVSARLYWAASDETADLTQHLPSSLVECPHELRSDQISSAAGTVPLGFARILAAEMFPHASAKLPWCQFAALLASTRVVGMRVPGLHSLFKSVDLKASPDSLSSMSYSVEEFDTEYSRTIIRIHGGGLSGTATAFLRPAPVAQIGFKEASKMVAPGEFTGERAIVIGGSRGLGEIAVKQLTAGGAAVKFSYYLGEADARKLVEEISICGGAVECFQLDVKEDLSALRDSCRGSAPTMVCFFSTPPVVGAPLGKFSSELFHKLCQVYIDGFLNVFAIALAGGSLKGVLQPSSESIETTPTGMIEYSASKAAAETLIRGLQEAYPDIRFCAPRWGRMPTDLTASIVTADTTDAAPTVLAALRQMKTGSHHAADSIGQD